MKTELTQDQIFFLNGYCHAFALKAYDALYEDEQYRAANGLEEKGYILRLCMGLSEDQDSWDDAEDCYPTDVEHCWVRNEKTGLCFDAKGWRTFEDIQKDFPYLATDWGFVVEGHGEVSKIINEEIDAGSLKKYDGDAIHEQFLTVYKMVEGKLGETDENAA